eukprot:PITA_09768
MEEGYNSLFENQTSDLVPLPSGRKLVLCKRVYKTKIVADGKITRQKVRLVAKGFQEVHVIDYDEIFAPVAKMGSIHLALAIVAARGWEVHQMDVKNVFLHEDLSEEIYMEQPYGFIQDSFLVCRVQKSLYGLKTYDSLLILVLYVDDLLITNNSASAIAAVKKTLRDRFLMTDMGPLHFFLGLEINQDATGIKIS